MCLNPCAAFSELGSCFQVPTLPNPLSTPRLHFQSLTESLSSLLKKSPTHSNLQEARVLHARLLVDGQAPLLGSLLVQLYAHFGSFQEALLVFRTLRSFHNITCNAVLRAYVDAALFSEAIHFFTHLVFDLGFVPDNYTCPLIFKACSGLFSLHEGRKVHVLIRSFEFRNLFKPNAYTKSALIDMFAKCGSLDDAREVFDDMPQKERDLASWTAIICGTIRQGQGHEALRLFEMMRQEDVSPDSAVMAAILPACGRLETEQTGMALQGFAYKSGFHTDLFVCNAIIDMYCKFGDTCQAYDMFCRMRCRDDVSWRTLIAGYSQNSQCRKCLELFLEMINLGVRGKYSSRTWQA
ncbi:hypothetical protein ACS0TY_005103 [Phlomoides rotata]